jgi:hypothetical protein
MAGTSREMVVKTPLGETVARIGMKDKVLHGHCEWYDLRGNMVAYGFFRDGVPIAGTFLNWANVLGQLDKATPYDAAAYCQDWVTVFEAHYASQPPDYTLVAEAYCNGARI